MKFSLIIISLLISIVNCDIHQCSCQQIHYQYDCSQQFDCEWNDLRQLCQISTKNKLKQKFLSYCSSINLPQQNCSKTIGCAYIDGECTHFTGCTAYAKQTNYECQQISNLCISDGTQCKKALKCEEYHDQFTCQANPSISGTYQCKWEYNQCKDQQCNDASSSMKTDQQCNQWLQGCISTGNGCTTTLQPCNSYKGNKYQCEEFIGSDGKCTTTEQGENCSVRLCASALNTFSSDKECQQYQKGCITNGKGCITPPLPLCSQYTGDLNTCVGYLGQDGPCFGEINEATCRSRKCSDAPETIKTDQLCEIFKAGCVTNGLGCTQVLEKCSSFKGDNTKCNQYIGLDGFCTNTSDTVTSCKVKLCEEAPKTFKSDIDCEKYQKGCKTNGKGCTAHLQTCSSYLGTITTCIEFRGSDGNCKGINEIAEQPCAPKLCSDASLNLTTNEQCENFQNGCISNGNGCKDQATCLNNIKQISCIGTFNCNWLGFCSNDCSQLLTQQTCQGTRIGNKTCFWDRQVCRNLKCTDISQEITTDEECQLQLASCITNGKGCLENNSNCQEFFGTEKVCEQYSTKIKCSNSKDATLSSQCQVKSCSLNSIATSDEECQQYFESCKTNGLGCIKDTEPCSSYKGSQKQCSKFFGEKSYFQCWNDIDSNFSSSCRNKICSDVNSIVDQSECQSFAVTCLYNGSGCTDQSSPCSAYFGTQEQCSAYKGNDGTQQCWSTSTNFGSCKEKICGDAPTSYSTDSQCEQYLNGCKTNLQGCIISDAECSAYHGTQATCKQFIGANGTVKCWNDIDSNSISTCRNKICSDFSSVVDQSECQSFAVTCLYNGSGCTDQSSPCSAYFGTQEQCSAYKGNDGTQQCWSTSTNFGSCKEKICGDAPTSYSTDSQCEQYLNGCKTNLQGCIISDAECSAYHGTQATCKQFIGSNGTVKCWNDIDSDSNSSCRNKICSDFSSVVDQFECQSFAVTCLYNGSGCTDQSSPCSAYFGTQEQCSAYKGNNGTQLCWSSTTNFGSCKDRICADAPTSYSTDSQCEQYLNGCKTNSQGCIISDAECSAYHGTQATCKQFIGSNGTVKCWNDIDSDSTSSCRNKICSDFGSVVDQSECQSFAVTCLYNGSGCTDQSSPCSAYFGTQEQCSAYKGNNGTQLCWSSTTNFGSCKDRICADAPTSYSTDSQCEQYLNGCKTNSQGCIISDAECSAYHGTQATCKQFIGANGTVKCWNDIDSNSISTCRNKICSDFSSVVDQSECQSFAVTCLYNGSGCTDQSSPCSSYFGTQEQCSAYKGNNGTQLCWSSTTNFGSCKDRICTDAPITNTTNQDCDAFLTGCLTNGQGCLPITAPCNHYQGSQSQCSLFIGNGISCYNFNYCKNRSCSNLNDPLNNDECISYLPSCRYFKGNCVTASNCTQYFGNTLEDCSVVLDKSNKSCWWESGNTCSDRNCDNAPSSVSSQADCDYHFPGCLYVGNKCQTKSTCNQYLKYGDGSLCYSLTDLNNNLCQSSDTSSYCVDRTCANAPQPLSASICSNHKTGCIFDSINCISKGDCNTYLVSGSESEKRSLCSLLVNLENLTCTWSNGNYCENPSCQNAITPISQTSCDQHLENACLFQFTCITKECQNASNKQNFTECNNWKTNCQWNGNYSCMNQVNTCSEVDLTQANTQQIKLKICEGISLNSSTQVCEYNQTLGACQNRTCTGNITAMNPAECLVWLNKCQWNGTIGCTDQTENCQATIALGSSNEIKQLFCENLQTAIGIPCSYVNNDNNCKDRCITATGQLDFTTCDQFFKNCQWDGGSSCMIQVNTCSEVNLTNAATNKQQVCQGIQVKSGTKCQFNLAQQVCENRTCIYNTTAQDKTSCNEWMATCQWNGTNGCIDQPGNCQSLNVQLITDPYSYCRQIETIDQFVCAYKPGSLVCVDKCTIATNKYDFDGCESFEPGCQYDGNDSCMVQVTNCVDVNLSRASDYTKEYICSQVKLKGSDKKCFYFAYYKECDERTCFDNDTATSQQQCRDWLEGCNLSRYGQGCTSTMYETCAVPGAYTYSISSKIKICEEMPTQAGFPCTYDEANDFCIDKCLTATLMSSFESCNQFLNGCQYDGGSSCMVQVSNCIEVDLSKAGSISNKELVCTNISLKDSTLKCIYSQGNDKCETLTCENIKVASSNSECEQQLSGCLWNGGSGCSNKVSSCAGVDTSKVIITHSWGVRQFCEQIQTDQGFKCQEGNSSNCEDAPCINKIDASSQSDCSTWNKNCRYNGTPICQEVQLTCQNYIIPNSASNQASICDSLTDSSGNLCLSGISSCINRTCNNISSATNNSDCQQWNSECKYIGGGCMKQGSCSSYLINGSDNSNRKTICYDLGCTYIDNSNSCVEKTCQNISPEATSQNDCQNWLNICRWNGQECIYQDNCENYTIPTTITSDSSKLTYCLNLSDSSFNLCTFDKLYNESRCARRTCDNYYGTPSIDADCKEFLNSCAITFPPIPKCIPNNSLCSSFFGTPDQCKNFIGNGKQCSQENNISSSSYCVDKQCNHNVSATTDKECESFLIGCKTNGQGCIDANTSCSEIFSPNLNCTSLKGSDNRTNCLSFPCRDKTCQDDQTSTTDQQCQSFLQNCLTKGMGCINSSEPCSSYQGTQSICAAFTGNGQKCWSLSTTISTNCIDKQCIHNSTAITDQECEQFLPKDVNSQIQRCVTNGQGCVDYPRTCSQFNGTDAQCAKFTATDGPCKQAILNGSGQCTSVAAGLTKGKRRLAEEQIGFYQCQNSTSLDQCQMQGCLWVEMCVDQFNDCTSISNFGQRLCESTVVSYGLKRCKWNETICQDIRCEDLINSIYINHQNCQNVSDTCTTTGTGCITMGQCDSYKTQQICINARSIESNQTCVWGEQSCRNKRCSDAPKIYDKDYQCDQYLKRCKTNGQGCVNYDYQCSEILTQEICIMNGNEQPCLWVKDQCYSYTQCEDINFKTQEECSQISQQCTSDGTKCVPIDKCHNYTNSISCQLGIDGVCQWQQQENKCQIVEHCTDIKTSNSQICQIFSINCIYDGMSCIVKSTCSTYTTKIACNSGGTDGQCAFIPTAHAQNGTCKQLSQCSDANFDQIACTQKSNQCFWKEDLNNTECITHNCTTISSNNICNPIELNNSTLVICVETDIGCVEGQVQQLNQELCFKNTNGTYTWNPDSGKCEKCQIIINIDQPRCFLKELIVKLLILNFLFNY